MRTQSLTVKLPCKVGDKVYRKIGKDNYDAFTVEKINVYIKKSGIDYCLICESDNGCGEEFFDKDELNEKWVFEKKEQGEEK